MTDFRDISLLITHYNRSKSLEKLLRRLYELNLYFYKIVISDDGSKPEHLDYVKSLKASYSFSLITAPENKGLGNNINKGQNLIKSPYTLYIQDDFLPNPKFAEKLEKAQQFLEQDEDLDFVRFYAYFKFPNLSPVSDGFSEMHFSHLKFWQGYRKFYVYSDHPHLRRRNFFDRFGKYDEGIKSDRTEYNMMMRVLAGRPKAYFYDDFNALLSQENSVEEPSTVNRNMFRNNNSYPFVITRVVYRYVRFNLELFIFKIKRITHGSSLV